MDREELYEAVEDILSNNWEGAADSAGDWSDAIDVVFNKQSGNFKNEKKNGLQFAFKITSSLGVGKRVCLNPGHFASVAALNAAGYPCDAILADGVMIDVAGKQLKAAVNGRKSIAELLSFVKVNPSRVSQISLAANDVAIYESEIGIQNASPFKNSGEEPLSMSQYFDVTQNQDKKIIIPMDNRFLQLDDQTLLFVDVPAQANGVDNVEMIFTFEIGAVLNAATALNRMAEESILGRD